MFCLQGKDAVFLGKCSALGPDEFWQHLGFGSGLIAGLESDFCFPTCEVETTIVSASSRKLEAVGEMRPVNVIKRDWTSEWAHFYTEQENALTC